MRVFAVLSSALAMGLPASFSTMLAAQAPALTPDTFAMWRDRIRPSAAELAWRKIAWHAELGPALAKARAAKKPVLLWAMNGHPLGCV